MALAGGQSLLGPWPAVATVHMQPANARLKPDHLVAAIAGVEAGPTYLTCLASALNNLTIPMRPAHEPVSAVRPLLPGSQLPRLQSSAVPLGPAPASEPWQVGCTSCIACQTSATSGLELSFKSHQQNVCAGVGIRCLSTGGSALSSWMYCSALCARDGGDLEQQCPFPDHS